MTITLGYAGLLAVLMAVLSIRVPLRRLALGAPWGEADDDVLATRVRVFGNFTEYVPMIVVLIALLEASGAAPGALHGLGISVLVSRTIHAVALRKDQALGVYRIGRAIGAFSTWLILLAAAAYGVVLAYL